MAKQRTIVRSAAILAAVWISTAVAGQEIGTVRVASGLSRPVYVGSPAGDTNRLFIVEQHTGQIKIMNLNTGTINPTPFLDIDGIATGNEQGLLGLAFDPDFATNGHFYINATFTGGTFGQGLTQVRRYTVSGNPDVANAGSSQLIIQYDQPQSNHNAGWLDFGPDGYLYIASGDGGGGDDSGTGHTAGTGNAQDITANLLGKMLRIDPRTDAFPADATRHYTVPASNPFVGVTGDDEIWAYGLRNPYRNSFDRQTGDLYIADVGQNVREEINVQPGTSTGGENYGWRLREGTGATPSGGVGGDKPVGAIDPIYEYSHGSGTTQGFAVVGGYVYRGPIASLQGVYFFGDNVTDRIWSLRWDGSAPSTHNGTNYTEFTDWTTRFIPDVGAITDISSFGEDAAGNLYIVDLTGEVFRVVSLPPSATLVEAGSTWRYLDDGSNQGTAWRERVFNDAGWAQGPAQLGYGDGDEATVVAFIDTNAGQAGVQKNATTYFRHSFDLTDIEATWVDELKVALLRDDGAAVYLNGVQLVRDNLAAGAAFNTFATAVVDGANENTFFNFTIDLSTLPAGTLRQTGNVLAVEIHQVNATSSDISFDLSLKATLRGDFDDDLDVDADDIDMLFANLGSEDDRFDVNNSGGPADANDVTFHVRTILNTQFGDLDLNKLVNITDLSTLAVNFGGVGGWAKGDQNGDGLITIADLSRLATFFGFDNTGMAAGQNVVPEPVSATMLLLAAATWRRRAANDKCRSSNA